MAPFGGQLARAHHDICPDQRLYTIDALLKEGSFLLTAELRTIKRYLGSLFFLSALEQCKLDQNSCGDLVVPR